MRTEKIAVDVFLQKTVEGAAVLKSSSVEKSQGNSMDALEVELTISLCFVDDAAKTAALTALKGAYKLTTTTPGPCLIHVCISFTMCFCIMSY